MDIDILPAGVDRSDVPTDESVDRKLNDRADGKLDARNDARSDEGPTEPHEQSQSQPFSGGGTDPDPTDLRDKLAVLDVRVRQFVSDRPAVAIVGAAALGFFAGRLLSRR